MTRANGAVLTDRARRAIVDGLTAVGGALEAETGRLSADRIREVTGVAYSTLTRAVETGLIVREMSGPRGTRAIRLAPEHMPTGPVTHKEPKQPRANSLGAAVRRAHEESIAQARVLAALHPDGIPTRDVERLADLLDWVRTVPR